MAEEVLTPSNHEQLQYAREHKKCALHHLHVVKDDMEKGGAYLSDEATYKAYRTIYDAIYHLALAQF